MKLNPSCYLNFSFYGPDRLYIFENKKNNIDSRKRFIFPLPKYNFTKIKKKQRAYKCFFLTKQGCDYLA